MGLYDRYVLPHTVDFTCSRRPQMRQRGKIVPLASGVVLEIGFGSGLNLPYYEAEKVERVLALEPSDEMWTLAAPRVADSKVPVERIPGGAEQLPLPEASIDSAVVTYTLCTIPEPVVALEAVRRALRPGGRLYFSEHGAAPDPELRRWQDRIDPIWGWFAGGCHINRDIPRLLEDGGFRTDAIETMYLPGVRLASFTFWGGVAPR